MLRMNFHNDAKVDAIVIVSITQLWHVVTTFTPYIFTFVLAKKKPTAITQWACLV